MIPEETREFEGKHGTTQYITVALPFKAGYKLGLELAGIVSPVIGSAVGALFGVASVDEKIDTAEAASKLGNLPMRLLELEDSNLISRVFARTYRVVDGKKRPLRDDEEMTNAFAGNYGEFFRVAWWVLGVNYAPFGMTDNPAWEELRSKLGTWLSLDNLTTLIPSTEEMLNEPSSEPNGDESA